MRISRVLILIVVLPAFLTGCQTVRGWFSQDDPELEPAELVEFEATVQLERQWSTNTGRGGNRSRPNFRPFEADGLIWVGDYRGRVVAVDADGGRVERDFRTGLDLSAGPAVYEDRVLLGTFNSEVAMLDAESGDMLWKREMSSEILGYPVLHDNIVVVRSIDGRTFGLDASNGDRIWIHDRSVPLLTLRGNSDPLVRAGQAFIGHDDGMMSALRVRDGSVLWEQRVSEPEGRTELERLADIDGPMQIVGGELYAVTYRGRLAGMALESGRIMWVKDDVASYTGLSLRRTHLAVSDSRDNVWLVDRRNGSTEWHDDSLRRREITRPVFLGNRLAVVDFEGYLHLYNVSDGEFAARERVTRDRPADAPLVVGNTMYVLDDDGQLSAWRVN